MAVGSSTYLNKYLDAVSALEATSSALLASPDGEKVASSGMTTSKKFKKVQKMGGNGEFGLTHLLLNLRTCVMLPPIISLLESRNIQVITHCEDGKEFLVGLVGKTITVLSAQNLIRAHCEALSKYGEQGTLHGVRGMITTKPEVTSSTTKRLSLKRVSKAATEVKSLEAIKISIDHKLLPNAKPVCGIEFIPKYGPIATLPTQSPSKNETVVEGLEKLNIEPSASPDKILALGPLASYLPEPIAPHQTTGTLVDVSDETAEGATSGGFTAKHFEDQQAQELEQTQQAFEKWYAEQQQKKHQ